MSLNTLLESANPYTALQSDAAKLAGKWEKTGLLEGLDGTHKNNMGIILENQAKQLVVESSQAPKENRRDRSSLLPRIPSRSLPKKSIFWTFHLSQVSSTILKTQIVNPSHLPYSPHSWSILCIRVSD